MIFIFESNSSKLKKINVCQRVDNRAGQLKSSALD